MNHDHNTMTVDECRDWLANRAGWESKHNSWWHRNLLGSVAQHPIPATIDAAAAALPSGWFWCVEFYKETFTVRADTLGRTHIVPAFDCDSELIARFRLAVACCMVDDAARKERGE